MRERTNFKLVAEVVANLPDMAEIGHSEAFSSRKKNAGVEDDEIEGPVAPQYMPSVEIVEVFTPGANFALIPVTHEEMS